MRYGVGGDIGSQLEKVCLYHWGQLRMGLNNDAEDRTHIEHDKGRSGNFHAKMTKSLANSQGSSF